MEIIDYAGFLYANFRRPVVMRSLLPASASKLVEADEVLNNIRRSPKMPLPEMDEERKKEMAHKTVYVKGFGKEADMPTCRCGTT
jgi:hypothetical protein